MVKVHRSNSFAHALFLSVFIHRILLHLGIDEFLASEPVHLIAPIGATFLMQRATQMRASSKHPRVESSSGVAAAPPPPPSLGDPTIEEFVDLTATIAPSPSASNDSSIRHMLDTVMTVQAVHGQLLVDMLTELQALRADLASFRRSYPPPPFDDES